MRAAVYWQMGRREGVHEEIVYWRNETDTVEWRE